MMTLSLVTEEMFRAAIEKAPLDTSVRLQFADWLTDHGREIEALGQRWQAREGKSPRYLDQWRTYSLVNHTHKISTDLSSELIPDTICRHLPTLDTEPGLGGQVVWAWKSRIAAETALAHALHALGIDA